MSHDHGWRAACIVTIWIPKFHSEMDEVARGVTAMVVGSGALLGLFRSFLFIFHRDEDPYGFRAAHIAGFGQDIGLPNLEEAKRCFL